MSGDKDLPLSARVDLWLFVLEQNKDRAKSLELLANGPPNPPNPPNHQLTLLAKYIASIKLDMKVIRDALKQ